MWMAPVLQPHLAVRGLHHRVGGEDGARGILEAVRAQARDQAPAAR